MEIPDGGELVYRNDAEHKHSETPADALQECHDLASGQFRVALVDRLSEIV